MQERRPSRGTRAYTSEFVAMKAAAVDSARCGIVVIGRNEGERLRRSLTSAVASGCPVVYVDSRSTDDSVMVAKELGAEVVELDVAAKLSAALARHTGALAMMAAHPAVQYLQFIDGDCVLSSGWIERSVAALDADISLVAVCGFRREAEPRRNVFHRVVSIEWQLGGVGDVDAFGGDVMIRASAYRAAGGYNPTVVAGEDPDLSSRLRSGGGRLERLDGIATTHDIAMHSVKQWWKRAERGGYGGALVADLHRHTDRLYWHETKRSLLWGGVAPLVALVALRFTRIPLLLVAAKYALSTVRAARGATGHDLRFIDRAAWGVSCVAAGVPGAIGAARYLLEARRGRQPHIIEYK